MKIPNPRMMICITAAFAMCAIGMLSLENASSQGIRAATPQREIVVRPMPTWRSFPFAEGFINQRDAGSYPNAQPVQYMKQDGIVYLRGSVHKRSDLNRFDVFGTLPQGYRPENDLEFLQPSGFGMAVVMIRRGGNVEIWHRDTTPDTRSVSLDGIFFFASE